MKVLGWIVLALVAVAAIRLGLAVILVVLAGAFLVALFRDPVRVLVSAIAIVVLAAVLSLPPVVRVLTLLIVLFSGM